MAKKIEAKIGLNDTPFQSKLRKVRNSLKSFGSKIKSVFSGLGGILAGGALIAGVRSLVNEMDDIGKTAARIGVSTDAMQKLKIASELSGNSISTIQTAFKRMSAVAMDAADGSKMATDALAKLGMTADDLKGKKTEEMFELIVGKLRNVTNESEKSAIAQKIFGRSGQELIPLINTYKEIAAEAENTGAIIAESNIKAAEKLNDNITKFTASAKKTTVGIVGTVAGWFNSVKESIQDATNIARGGVSKSVLDRHNKELEDYNDNIKKARELKLKEAEATAIATKAEEKRLALNYELGQLQMKHQSGNVVGNYDDFSDEEIEGLQTKIKLLAELDKLTGGNTRNQKESFSQSTEDMQAKIDKEKQAQKIAKDGLSDMLTEINYQKMIDAGQENEVEYLKKKKSLEDSMGRKLNTDENKALLTRLKIMAKIKKDREDEAALAEKTAKQEKDRLATIKKQSDEAKSKSKEDTDFALSGEKQNFSDSFSRIGGQLGGVGNQVSDMALQKNRNNILTNSKKTLDAILKTIKEDNAKPKLK